MAFFGKVYKFTKQENFDDYMAKLGLPAPIAEKYSAYQPSQQLVDNKDGTYTLNLVFGDKTKSLTFKSGVEFDEDVADRKAKTTVTLSGNVLTQVQKFEDGHILTFKKEFNDSELKHSLSVNGWDGTAYRYYSA